jgi:hypothetical protein
LARSLKNIPEVSLNGSGRKSQLGPTKHMIWKKMKNIVSPDRLFCRLFIASSPKYYFGNPEWFMEWLGAVDHVGNWLII